MPRDQAGSDWAIGPGRATAVIVALLGLAAVLAVWLSGIHWALQALFSLMLLGYASGQLKRLLDPQWKAVTFEQGVLTVVDEHDCRHPVALRGRPFVSPVFIGFSGRLSKSRRRFTLGVFREQLAAEHFRRLAAELRSA